MKAHIARGQKIRAILAGALTVIGILLLAMKVYVDSEPGAIPLLLILVGTSWYFIQWLKIRSQRPD